MRLPKTGRDRDSALPTEQVKLLGGVDERDGGKQRTAGGLVAHQPGVAGHENEHDQADRGGDAGDDTGDDQQPDRADPASTRTVPNPAPAARTA